jgi:Leucine-rich repeat (LRR) protein
VQSHALTLLYIRFVSLLIFCISLFAYKGRLGNLTTLWLDDNKLEELPDDIGKLQRLTTLWLYGNKLTKIPSTMGSMLSLKVCFSVMMMMMMMMLMMMMWILLYSVKVLRLDDNVLGELPETIGQAKNLSYLGLRQNKLRSFIHSTFPYLSLPLSLSLSRGWMVITMDHHIIPCRTQDTTRHDTGNDTTRHDTTRHDTTRHDKTRQDKTRQDKTGQD